MCANIRGVVVTNYSSDTKMSTEYRYTVKYTILDNLVLNFCQRNYFEEEGLVCFKETNMKQSMLLYI